VACAWKQHVQRPVGMKDVRLKEMCLIDGRLIVTIDEAWQVKNEIRAATVTKFERLKLNSRFVLQ